MNLRSQTFALFDHQANVFSVTITQAEKLAGLGAWERALEVLDDLPPEERTEPPAIRLRLRCAIGLERWNLVKELADQLAKGGDEDRKSAAGAFQRIAGVATRARQIEAARDLVLSAIDAWPEIRAEVENDPELSVYLRG